jgi:hypothetical protein
VEGAVNGLILGALACAFLLLIAKWRTQDSKKEIASLSDMGVGGAFGAGLKRLLRIEHHFWVFASGMVAGITIMRAALGMGE